MCIRDRYQRRVRGILSLHAALMRVLVSHLDGPYGKELPGLLHAAGHTVVGTATVGWPKQPRFVDEIKYTTSEMDSLGEPVHECEGMTEEEFKDWVRLSDGYLVDIFTDVIEARAILQHIARARPNEEEDEAKKLFVALSNISTWANTTRPVDPDAPPVDNGEVSLPEPFKADDRGKDTEEEPGVRLPHPRFKREAGFEQLLCNTEWHNVDPILMCTGLVYGDGEDWLHPFFQQLWISGDIESAALQCSNRVPMVHRADVLTGVRECFGENRPDDNYILAVDESTSTWGEVAAAMHKSLGYVCEDKDPELVAREREEFEVMIEEATHHGYPEYLLFKSDFMLDTGPFVALLGEDVEGESPRWRARSGIVPAMDTVVSEYLTARMLGPKKIFIDTADLDTPCNQVQELGDRLAARFKVPHVTIRYAVEHVDASATQIQSDVTNVLQGLPTTSQVSEEEKAAQAEAAEKVETGVEAEEQKEEEEEGVERAEVPQSVEKSHEQPALTPAAPTDVPVPEAETIPMYESTVQVTKEQEYTKFVTADKRLLEQLYRHVLSNHTCRTRGFVLSGYPKTLAEARALFRDEFKPEPRPADGEEEEAVPAPKVGKDGKVDGELLPQFTIIVEGEAAHSSTLLPPASALISSSDSARERFQSVSRIALSDLETSSKKNVATESVIQTLGLPLHFDKNDPTESLLTRYRERQGELQDEDDAEEGSQLAESRAAQKERAKLENRQEALMPAVEREMHANVDPTNLSAREYALKYAVPAMHKAMCMIGRLRPQDPVEFMANFMMEFDPGHTDYLEPGALIIPPVSYTHLRAHETPEHLVCRLLLEKKKKITI
eukprot:TRINITY_DN21209_c0_g1_i2.p1 TRINITY_DN21209_c0_g1~~TRINITY_DN21209_c0_g1_i2.p1  ORF type:complete len:838 (-),score=250.05 TRINITY_DN21209_c0_g1_i2:66-2579(-)